MSEINFQEYNDITEERRELAEERVRELVRENALSGAESEYFHQVASFLELLFDTASRVCDGTLFQASLEEQKKLNHTLYQDILPEAYETSYANPTYAVKCFGKEMGQYLSFLYTEIRACIPRIFEKRLLDLTISCELFLEIYRIFEDNEPETLLQNVAEAVYYYAHDYSELLSELKTLEMMGTDYDFAYRILMEGDLSNPAYLYRYGEYITENETKLVQYLSGLDPTVIKAMADTYTDGYIRGFTTMRVDFSKKTQVLLRYPIGFELMMREAILTLEAMGKRVNLYRSPADTFNKVAGRVNGYTATPANPQYGYDHRFDLALYFDHRIKEHRLDCQKNTWEKFKQEASEYAGPAVVEVFGEPDFQPVSKPEAVRFSKQQEKLYNEYRRDAGILSMEYIHEEETSYTIIAYPLPSIGDCFDAVFRETIRLNNLDNEEYKRIQQYIVDELDRGEYVKVLGAGENHTELTVQLISLSDPEKQTKFENCTADVNIPVGEVFTSPKLQGTNGTLQVSSVFLNGLEYKDLTIEFQDGKVSEYSCSNFDNVDEGKSFIKENILMNHDTLPMGEFAIGTNTTAYRMGRKYGIQAKLPILIAEKTGPHFALGDTCYRMSEDHAVFNPDGKEIIARDNEISILRKTEMDRAYFNCHTDITIPYHEIQAITVCRAGGEECDIIRDGRFVLPGTEELNKALDEED